MTIAHHSDITDLAHADDRSASWWAAVARTLDRMDERLRQDSTEDDGRDGAFAASVERAPSLANEVTRLRADRNRLIDRARTLRRFVATVAGDAAEIPAVTGELDVLAAAETRYRERSRAVFWDSFSRDIGGE
jgi:hypothetical protein